MRVSSRKIFRGGTRLPANSRRRRKQLSRRLSPRAHCPPARTGTRFRSTGQNTVLVARPHAEVALRCAGIAECSEILRRIEAERSDVCNGRRAVRLRCIFHDAQIVLSCKLEQRADLRSPPVGPQGYDYQKPTNLELAP